MLTFYYGHWSYTLNQIHVHEKTMFCVLIKQITSTSSTIPYSIHRYSDIAHLFTIKLVSCWTIQMTHPLVWSFWEIKLHKVHEGGW